MNPHPFESDDSCDRYGIDALIRDMCETKRRQTRTLMLTLLAVTLLHMSSTVVSHVWL